MIYKFKTFEEAQKALWNSEPNEEYYKQIKALFTMAFTINPPQCKHGIFAFKTIEESNEFRFKEQIENAMKKL